MRRATSNSRSDAPKKPQRWRWLRRIGFGSVVSLVMAGMLVAWLLLTVSGRDTLLHRVVALLPAGSLTWERADGVAYGPLTLYGVHYRHNGVDLRARRMMLEASLRQLASWRLRLIALEVDDAALDLPVDRTPKPLPTWPGSLPRFAMPFALGADSVRVHGLRVSREGVPVLVAKTIAGGFELAPGKIALHRVAMDSDRGRLDVEGEVDVGRNYELNVNARLRSPAEAELRVLAQGDLDHAAIAVDGRAPDPFAAKFRLDDGRSTPHWTLMANAPRFDPTLLFARYAAPAQPEPPALPYAIALQVTATGGDAQLQGRIAQGERALVVMPSTLAYENGVLVAQPLAMKLLDGEAQLRGRADLRPAAPLLDVQLQLAHVHWSATARATPVDASGKLALAGNLDAWTLDGALDLMRDRQTANLILAGRGDRAQVALKRFSARTPQGAMSGVAQLHWSPRLAWNADLALQGFDPGYFAPGFEGAVSGRLQTDGGLDPLGSLALHAKLDPLSGQLRGRRLGGRGEVDWKAGSGTADVDLRVGASHVQAKGSFGRALDVLAHFDPLRLDDLLPDAQGSLSGQIAVHGDPAAPAIEGHLTGSALHWRHWGAAQFALDGKLPSRGVDGILHASADGVVGVAQLNAFDLHIAGSEQAPRVEGSLSGGLGALAWVGSAQHQGTVWNGRIATLHFTPPHGAAWNLVAPADIRYEGTSALHVQTACLRSPDATVCGDADWPHRANLQAHALPVGMLDPWLARPDLDAHAYGVADLDAHIAPDARGGWTGSAQLHSASGGLRLPSEHEHALLGYTDLVAQADLDGERVQLRLDTALTANGSVHAQVATGMDATSALTGSVSLDLHDIGWLELFSTDIAAPKGELSGRLALAGTRAHPTLSGRAMLDGLEAELPALGVALKQGHVQLDADADGDARISGSLQSGDGTLTLGGGWRWNDTNAPLTVSVRGQNVRIVDTPELSALASPDVQLGYASGTLSVRGTVSVPKAQMNLERLDNTVAPSPDVVVLDPADTTRRSALATDVDLSLALGDDVRLKGFGLDGKLGGQLRVRRAPGYPMTANGALDVSGHYRAYGQQLEIERGRLGYSGGGFDNPSLDILAQHVFDQATVGVQVRGTALRPLTQIVSTPALQPSDALAYLVMGRPLQSATADDGRQISAAAAALSVSGNMIGEKVGARLGLDEAGISDSRALGGSAFTVGKFISPRLFVSYGVSLIGTGEVLTLKYLLRKGFDIQFDSGIENRASINWRIEK